MEAIARLVAGHVGESPLRIDGIEMAEEEDGFGFVAPGEIDLDVVTVIFGAMDGGVPACCFEAGGEQGAHAVGGEFVVAGRFDFDEFADGLDEGREARFEIVEAFGPDRIEFVFSSARCFFRWHEPPFAISKCPNQFHATNGALEGPSTIRHEPYSIIFTPI